MTSPHDAYKAYNDFMDARVAVLRAAAAFVMKRRVKMTPSELAEQARKALDGD